jgi:hypothetical protein
MEGHISMERLRHLFSYGATHSEVNDGVAHIIACPSCWDTAAEAIVSLRSTKELVPAKRGRPPVHPFQDAREALIVLRLVIGTQKVCPFAPLPCSSPALATAQPQRAATRKIRGFLSPDSAIRPSTRRKM